MKTCASYDTDERRDTEEDIQCLVEINDYNVASGLAVFTSNFARKWNGHQQAYIT